MSRVAPVLAAFTLVIVVAGELAAQTPTLVPGPSPVRVDRVAVPEQGYAVRVPPGAFGIDLSADIERQVLTSVADEPAAAGWLFGDDPNAIASLIVALEDSRDSGWQVVVMGDEAMCHYSAIRETPPDFDTFALDLYTALLNDERYTQVELPAFLELDSSLAVLLRATASYGPPYQGGYAGVREDATYWVICRGPVERDDRWRSFAEAFEW